HKLLDDLLPIGVRQRTAALQQSLRTGRDVLVRVRRERLLLVERQVAEANLLLIQRVEQSACRVYARQEDAHGRRSCRRRPAFEALEHGRADLLRGAGGGRGGQGRGPGGWRGA